MTDADLEDWAAIVQRLSDRSRQFHLASLEFLQKGKDDRLNAAIALKLSEEARKLDLSLMKIIYPFNYAPESRRRSRSSPKPTLSDSPDGQPDQELAELLKKLIFNQPEEEEEPYALDAGSEGEASDVDPGVATVGMQHGCHDSPR